MNTFEVNFNAVVEAANQEDAEELVIELLESDPAVDSWHLIAANDNNPLPETAVA